MRWWELVGGGVRWWGPVVAPACSLIVAALIPRVCCSCRSLAATKLSSSACAHSATGKKLHYKGAHFHRIIGSFMCQGGGIFLLLLPPAYPPPPPFPLLQPPPPLPLPPLSPFSCFPSLCRAHATPLPPPPAPRRSTAPLYLLLSALYPILFVHVLLASARRRHIACEERGHLT